jgi:calcineurin-like phosphoesterase family protein
MTRAGSRAADVAAFHAEGERRTSSRESPAGAGWDCAAGDAAWRRRWSDALKEVDLTPENARLSWKSIATLLSARHEKIVHPPFKWWPWPDYTHVQRAAWVADCTFDDFLIDRNNGDATREKVVFMLLGDTGEGDVSQYAVIEPLLTEGKEAEFTIIASDVVYPAGAANEYILKFYAPYGDVPGPIYAVPGNHDWDDGALTGFMYHVCGIDEVPEGVSGAANPVLRRARLWTKPPPPHSDASINRRTAWRQNTQRESRQKTPYWAIDAGPLRIIGIDTGVGGPIDKMQATWLHRVSEGSRPKILVTGKPIYVDGEYHPGEIAEVSTTVDDIVRQPANTYIAAIGGDIHNYQRYPVVVEGEQPGGGPRLIQYLVSGGGGAYTNGTHTLDPIHIENPGAGLPPIEEADFRSYPRRGDSLSYYSRVYADAVKRMSTSDRLLAKAIGIALDKGTRKIAHEGDGLAIDPALAAEVIARHTGVSTVRDGSSPFTQEQLDRGERVRNIVCRLPNGRLRDMYYPFWDRDDPPFFKSFVRFEVDGRGVLIRCFAATGCGEHERAPPLEDVLRWDRERGWSARYAGLGGVDETVPGRVEVYRRSATESDVVITVKDDAPVPEGAILRLSPTQYLSDATDAGELTHAEGGRFAPLTVAGNYRWGSVEIVDGRGTRVASGRFW